MTSHLPAGLALKTLPTIWGLEPVHIHDRFWAARGVQVVRQGERTELARGAELFLLTAPQDLLIFKLGRLIDTLSWIKPQLLVLRLRNAREQGYREVALADAEQRFLRFQRIYRSPSRPVRAALTPDREVARLWQAAPDPRAGWELLRREVPHSRRAVAGLTGQAYDASSESEQMQFVRDIILSWPRPDSTVRGLKKVNGRVWADRGAQVEPRARFVGPVWIGAGRRVEGEASVVGPAVLWDDPSVRPPGGRVEWSEIEPTASKPKPVRRGRITRLGRMGKRAFDIAFALLALLFTLPLYPLILLCIWLEDGRPFFFAHRRETLGGKVFPCLKFRSMRKDAEKLKVELKAQNQADGPQFHIPNDPRLTRVGRFLRDTQLDEVPQFLNVLLGHMSIVGPRPSPFEENQYCPPWREARLSVRPGITGLWQVKRTRAEGLDFQEWIKYDLEYVEKASFRLDLWILWRTIRAVLWRS